MGFGLGLVELGIGIGLVASDHTHTSSMIRTLANFMLPRQGVVRQRRTMAKMKTYIKTEKDKNVYRQTETYKHPRQRQAERPSTGVDPIDIHDFVCFVL